MNNYTLALLWPSGVFICILFIIGLYCIFATYNLIRALIGVEILIKAATFLLILVGFSTGNTSLAQSLVITLIVIEVVVVTVAVGVILGVHRHHNDLDLRKLRNLKG